MLLLPYNRVAYLVEFTRETIEIVDGGVVGRGGDLGFGGVPVRRDGEHSLGLLGEDVAGPSAQEIAGRAVVERKHGGSMGDVEGIHGSDGEIWRGGMDGWATQKGCNGEEEGWIGGETEQLIQRRLGEERLIE